MKASLFVSFLLLVIAVGCKDIPEPMDDSLYQPADSVSNRELDWMHQMHQDIDTVILGDMNFDGIMDSAIVFSPVHAYPVPDDYSTGGCEDDSCLTKVMFSFTRVPLLKSSALGFIEFFATADLDSDGIKEVGFVPKWWSSCWSSLYIFTLKNGAWQKFMSGSVYACGEEGFSNRIKKVGSGQFNFTVAVWNDDHGMAIDTTITYDVLTKLPASN